MNARKASIAFAGPAGRKKKERIAAANGRPKLMPEEVQALGEKAGAHMEERGIPALFEPRQGQQVRLAGGDSSCTLLSARHGRVVEKFYKSEAEALHEWRMVQYFEKRNSCLNENAFIWTMITAPFSNDLWA